MFDLVYGCFIDLCLTEHGDKKMEAIAKVNSNFRGTPVIKETIMPDAKPVND